MTKHGRQWDKAQIAGGYDKQDWGPPPAEDSEVIGTYQGLNGTITVSHVADGVTGVAELEIAWEDGPKVTVLNEEVALQYLAADGAVELVPD